MLENENNFYVSYCSFFNSHTAVPQNVVRHGFHCVPWVAVVRPRHYTLQFPWNKKVVVLLLNTSLGKYNH